MYRYLNKNQDYICPEGFLTVFWSFDYGLSMINKNQSYGFMGNIKPH